MDQENSKPVFGGISLENVVPLIDILRQEFAASHGEDAFAEYYIKQFNEKPVMQARTFNRSAQPIMVSLFFATVLKKEKELQDALIDGFTAETQKPWNGQKEEFTHKMRDQMLYDLQDTADKLLKDRSKPKMWQRHADNDPLHIAPAA